VPNHEAADLRELRTRRNVSQAAVARLAGVSVGHISRVESGHRPPTPAVINGYEKAFGVRLAHLPPTGGGDTLSGKRPGEDVDEMRRRAFTAAVAAIAAGGPLPPWMTGFLNEAHVYSVTGQAAYALARTTGRFSDEAHQRLSRAIDGFDGGRARAVALCATRLAALHLHAGNASQGTAAAHAALRAVPGLRSARITRDLTVVRAAADRYTDDSTRQLSDDITATIAIQAPG
jgi:transcriptional regulator with XRE-family HTH domain